MNNTFPDVSAKQLSSAGLTLQDAISAATDHAKTVLTSGEFVRMKRNEGNMNSSLESTSEGAINAADKIARHFDLDVTHKSTKARSRAFFGENIRRTVAAFRVLGRK